MKLQTKLTLWFSVLLLLVYAALLTAMHMISGRAAEATARTTLESAVARYADEIDYERGRLLDFKARNYDEGAYLLVYSADGGTLMAGTDIFGLSSMMPDLLWNNKAETVFRVDAEEAGVYCYILHLTGDQTDRSRGGRPDVSRETASGEIVSSGEADTDGIWIVGVLPEDSMENVTGSIERYAVLGLPVVALLTILGSQAITRRSLLPLRKITESAREISDGHDLSRRIDIGKGRDEAHELADTFNDMMCRLERSFDAERQFTSDASHELRTPTTVILAECEMAERTPEDAEAVQESVVEIHKQVRKMSELIGKLLSYTRLEQGTRKIDRDRLDLGELTSDICEEQKTVAVRDIAIECQAEPEVYVDGDAALLISLVQNLITNAVKYGKDHGHVFVRVYREKNSACVSVRDDGIGISPEDLDRIWNRFYQADRSRSDESRGVGLGLSLAQQIARLHDGNITASSIPGEGSEFIFSMPLA